MRLTVPAGFVLDANVPETRERGSAQDRIDSRPRLLVRRNLSGPACAEPKKPMNTRPIVSTAIIACLLATAARAAIYPYAEYRLGEAGSLGGSGGEL